MHCSSLIDELYAKNEAMKTMVQNQLESLLPQQWLWSPRSGVWCAAESLDHLNLTLEMAFEGIEPALEEAERAGWAPTEHYAVGWIGELAVQLMDNSDNRRYSLKFKTNKALTPQAATENIESIYRDFVANLARFQGLLERSRTVPLGKVRVRVLPSAFVRFRLGDTLRFMTAHSQRHLKQVENLLQHQDFPQIVNN